MKKLTLLNTVKILSKKEQQSVKGGFQELPPGAFCVIDGKIIPWKCGKPCSDGSTALCEAF